MQNPTRVGKVSVVTTGHALAHREHIYGTKKPSYWWPVTKEPSKGKEVDHG